VFISKQQLKEIVPYIKEKNLDLYSKPLNEAMYEFGINTKPRISAFIAQIAHESGSFHYVKELASGAAYDDREDLGNRMPLAIEIAEVTHKTTAGRLYKGRGLIQITGFYNYRDCGVGLGLDLINNPEQLEKPEAACRSAAWFWDSRELNILADRNEFRKITQKINGGYTGIAERFEFYFNALKIL